MIATHFRTFKHAPAFFFLLFLFAGNYLFLLNASFIGFHNHDWGGFMDASYRMYRGQLPYVDFYYHSGPLHPYMNVFFFKIFGFGKDAILAHLVTVNSLVCLATFFITYRRIPFLLTCFSTLLTLAFYYWIYPHPYYDYSAHFWGILGITALSRELPSTSAARACLTAAACGAAVTFASMCKINVGAAYFAVFGAVFLFSPFRLYTFPAYASGLLVGLAAVLLLVPDIGALIENMFVYGFSQTSRFAWLLNLKAWLWNGYSAAFAAAALYVLLSRRVVLPLFVLFAGTAFAGLFTRLTSSSFKEWWIYKPLLGVFLALAFLLLYQAKPAKENKRLKYVFYAVLTALVVSGGVQMQRSFFDCYLKVRYKIGFLKEFIIADVPPGRRYYMKSGPFKGWLHVDVVGRPLEEMADYIKQNVPENEELLVMSRLQSLYWLTGRQSYKGVPFHWDIDTSPAPGQRWNQVRDYLLNDPPAWLVLSSEEGYQINAIFKYMELPISYLSQYEQVGTWSNQALLRRIRVLKPSELENTGA